MFRVAGLYGHAQSNNRKTVVLLAVFFVLGVAVQLPGFFVIRAGQAIMEQQGVNTSGVFVHTSPSSASARPPAAAASEAMPDQGGVLATLVGLVQGAGALFMAYPVPAAAVLVALYLSIATWWNGLYIRYALRARPLLRREHPALYDIVENLAISVGQPCPAIEVIESDGLNAYASGLTPASARIGLTTGLIRRLDRSELEAVIAHEFCHIRNGDSRLMAIVKACTDLIVTPTLRHVTKMMETPVQTAMAVVLLLAIAAMGQAALLWIVVLAWALVGAAIVLAWLIKSMILQAREFVADVGAIEMTKNPAALIAALRKIDGADHTGVTNLAVQAMLFSGASTGWLATHPATAERIAAIRRHANVAASDEAEHRARPVRAISARQPSPAVAAASATRRVAGTLSTASAATTARSTALPLVLRARAQSAHRATFDAPMSAGRASDGTLFERYVMSGRLEAVKTRAKSAGRQAQSAFRYLVVVYLVVVMGFGLIMSAVFR